MINWKTILSTFNDKPTLMQWLKIVEKALENASLESVTAKTAPNNAVAFEFKFADGSTVTSTAANLEAKGISGIEEVSDEVVGNQTLTTLRAHYTDGTTDEFPVYAENGSKLYLHILTLKNTTSGISTNARILSSLPENFTFDYLFKNSSAVIYMPRLQGEILYVQLGRSTDTNTLQIKGVNVTSGESADITGINQIVTEIIIDLQ